MRTDDLIGILAQGAGAADRPDDAGRLGLGAALALPVMVAAVALVLGLVPTALWPVSATVPKLSYALALTAGGALLLRQAGRPGASAVWPTAVVLLVLVMAAVVGLVDLLRQPRDTWGGYIMGHSALICPFAILALSLPALGAMLWGARVLAPVRLRLAGAAAGLAAGGLGALAYSLGCTEGALTFVALWYTGGIALATGLGWLAGPRLLRW
ncbi:MAG: NrsF family protein [Gemmobacter sp.]